MYTFNMKKEVKTITSLRLLLGVYTGSERFLCLLAVLWIALGSPFWINQAVSTLRGPWLDGSVSEVLSERYGAHVRVRNVRFSRWSDIHFESIRVDSLEGRPLLRSSQGRLSLKNIALWKKMVFETEVRLQKIEFMKDYYQRFPNFKTWSFLVQKPIRVEELRLRVVQDRVQTVVGVLECASRDIRVDGGLTLNKFGGVKDLLHISVTPWLMVRSLV